MIASGRRRRPPLIQVSLWAHLGGAAALAVAPDLWPWTIGALAANHAVLGTATLLPRSSLLGPNVTRLSVEAACRREIALTFDDGPHPENTPVVLDLLEEAGIRATFFCIGDRAGRHPELVAEIVRRGHQVENHSLRHRHDFALYGPRRLHREIGEAQEILERAAGRPPTLFRAPAGFRGPFLDRVLQAHGLRLVSWTARGYDGVPGDPRRVFARLSRRAIPGAILLLHDNADAVRESLTPLLAFLRDADLRPVTLAHGLGRHGAPEETHAPAAQLSS